MNPTDYEYEPPDRPFDEAFATDPRATQRVAASRRARQTTPDVALAPRDVRQMLPVAVLLILAAAVIIALTSSLTSTPSRPLALTPAASAEARPTDVPSFLSQHNESTSTPVLVTMIDAYAAPGGIILGPLNPASERLTFDGRHKDGWLWVGRSDGSHVWVRQADLVLDADDLAAIAVAPDLTPRDTPPPMTAPMMGRGNGLVPASAPLVVEQQPAAEMVPADVGQKPTDDRAAHHRAAVDRLQRPPSDRDMMTKGSK